MTIFSGGDASEQRAHSQLNGLLNRGQLTELIEATGAFQWSPLGEKGMVIRWASSPGSASEPAHAPAAAAKAAASAPGSASAVAPAPAAAAKVAAAAPGSASASAWSGWLRWEWIEWITGLPA